MPAASPPSALPIMAPNLFHLAGPNLRVTYASTRLRGQPHMTYQDAQQARSFQAQEIHTIEDTELGTLVSVVLHAVPDVGSTTFSLLIPRMAVKLGTNFPVRTLGIMTLHSVPLALPGAVLGQLDTYTVMQLRGTAQAVLT